MKMLLILMNLLIGLALGKMLNEKLIKLNEKIFSLLSTLFIFCIGLSLGLDKDLFNDITNALPQILLLTFTASLGSIVSTSLLTKLIEDSNE
jgi:uncharacterized transporter YbjL